LLLTAGLFLRVLSEFHTADPGFAVENLLYVNVLADSGPAFYPAVTDRLRALPA